MGVWGAGLYSNDLAVDLRDATKAILRSPLAPEAIVGELRVAFPAADEPADEEHTTFWLVLADQFNGAGIRDGEVLRRARDIITSGADSDTMRRLEMTPSDLRRREKALLALLTEWQAPVKGRRNILTKPQPHAFPAGACVSYPLMGRTAINPYFPSAERMNPPFVADGWSAFVVLRNFHVHGVFAMTMVAVLAIPRDRAPDMASCESAPIRIYKRAWSDAHAAQLVVGTLSPAHAKKMRCAMLAVLPLDDEVIRRTFPLDPDPPRYADVSVSNFLGLLGEASDAVQATALRIQALRA